MSKPTCAVDECTSPSKTRGWCEMHYRRWLDHGDPNTVLLVRLKGGETCSVEGCGDPVRSRTWCARHYSFWQRTKRDPHTNPIRPIHAGPRLTSDGYSLVWAPGHPVSRGAGTVLEHRVVLYDALGPGEHPCAYCPARLSWDVQGPHAPGYLTVHHVNHNRADNALGNLVPCCMKCNLDRRRRKPRPQVSAPAPAPKPERRAFVPTPVKVVPDKPDPGHGECSIGDCERPSLKPGSRWCWMHYQRNRKYGSPIVPGVPERQRGANRGLSCSLDNCGRPAAARGWCQRHYSRWRRTGSFEVADPNDYRKVTKAGYVEIRRAGHPLSRVRTGVVMEHRFVLYEAIGPGTHPCNWCAKPVTWDVRKPGHPDFLTVDHLNWDPADNRLENLVPSCLSCNQRRCWKPESA